MKMFSVIKHQTVNDHILSQKADLKERGGEGKMSVTLEMTSALHMTFNSVISMDKSNPQEMLFLHLSVECVFLF